MKELDTSDKEQICLMILASGQIENLDIFESFFRQLRVRQKELGKVDLGSGFIHKAHGVGCIGLYRQWSLQN